jgi:hypothetical protein
MIPTKFSTLTNQEVMEKLTELTAKRENGRCYFTDPEEAADTVQEARNRIEIFCSYLNSIKEYLISKAKECGDAATLRVRFHTINEIYEDLFQEKMPNTNPYIKGGEKCSQS